MALGHNAAGSDLLTAPQLIHGLTTAWADVIITLTYYFIEHVLWSLPTLRASCALWRSIGRLAIVLVPLLMIAVLLLPDQR